MHAKEELGPKCLHHKITTGSQCLDTFFYWLTSSTVYVPFMFSLFKNGENGHKF